MLHINRTIITFLKVMPCGVIPVLQMAVLIIWFYMHTIVTVWKPQLWKCTYSSSVPIPTQAYSSLISLNVRGGSDLWHSGGVLSLTRVRDGRKVGYSKMNCYSISLLIYGARNLNLNVLSGVHNFCWLNQIYVLSRENWNLCLLGN